MVAFGAYEGRPSVFKMASTLETAKHTRNEKNWNNAVHLIDPRHRSHFSVPKVYADGEWNKLYYFISDWYTTDPIARLQAFDALRVRQWLPVVARANREIELLEFPESCEFLQKRVSSRSSKIPADHKLLVASREWASLVPRDLSGLITYLESIENIRRAPAHGDFVLRQMFEQGSTIGLIDGEHAGAKGVLHLDVAQMYIRLISDWDQWELARDYLLLFRELLPKEEGERFWQDLKPPLTQRFIGDLWGSKNNPKNLDRLLPLRDLILQDKII